VVAMTHSGHLGKHSLGHQRFNKSLSSTGEDFRKLTPLVVVTALRRARTVVCEPIHRFRLDTSGEPGHLRGYAVAAVVDGESAGPLSHLAAAAPLGSGPAEVTIEVGGAATGELPRPWEPMIGSEHLSCLLRRDRTAGRVIGTELSEAFRIAHDELGVRAVRAHGILGDDLGVYTESNGRAVHDFSGIDRVYDELLATGLRPIVELSFMPAALARDPGQTVFTWRAIVSPPRDWDRWADLVRDLADHLVARHGGAEVVSRWGFEVWAGRGCPSR
jgi:xylan 1,4-beta-xylosidase